MAADDIQPTFSTSAGPTLAPPAVQSAGSPVSADVLERWMRAVTAPPRPPENDADSPLLALLAVKSDQSTQPDPSEPAHQSPAHRLGGMPLPEVTFNAASKATAHADGKVEPTPAPKGHVQAQARALQPGSDDAPQWPSPTVQSPSRPASFVDHTQVGETTAAGNPAMAPSSPRVLQRALPNGSASPAGVQRIPTPQPTPRVSAAATPPTDGAAFADAGLTTAGVQASVRQDGGALRTDYNGPRDMDSPVATATQTSTQATESTLASMDADSARALPLSALRGRHASHRDSRLDAASADRANAERSPLQPTTPAATADAWMARVQAPPSPDGAVAFDAVNPAGGSEQLHALIESCCSRLWVSDGGGRVPQGVMLDLGRWMPGCTVEVAKAAGVLRITLRGVEGSDRQRLEEELTGLGDGLAQKLGCQVVAAVATNKELT